MTATADIIGDVKRPRTADTAGGLTHQEVAPVSKPKVIYPRRCEGCGVEFFVGGATGRKKSQRFCGRSCAMKWTASQRGPYEHLAECNRRKRTKHSERDGVIGKPCNRCKQWQPLTEYHSSKPTPDGLEHRCKSCNRERARAYYRANADRINAAKRTPEYRARFRPWFAEWEKERRATDPNYKIKRLLRARVYRVLKGIRKDAPMLELLGAPIEVVRRHIEAQFTEGMSWDNHGQPGWEIDHIIPCAAFDLTDPAQQRACFNYKNLQPLWGPDNWAKGAKL